MNQSPYSIYAAQTQLSAVATQYSDNTEIATVLPTVAAVAGLILGSNNDADLMITASDHHVEPRVNITCVGPKNYTATVAIFQTAGIEMDEALCRLWGSDAYQKVAALPLQQLEPLIERLRAVEDEASLHARVGAAFALGYLVTNRQLDPEKCIVPVMMSYAYAQCLKFQGTTYYSFNAVFTGVVETVSVDAHIPGLVPFANRRCSTMEDLADAVTKEWPEIRIS